RVVDLHGRMLMPGLIDGHLHPVDAGLDLLKCDLDYEPLTLTEFQRRIQSCLDKEGHDSPNAWFEVVHWFRYGMNTGGQPPTRAMLDSLHTRRPIIVHDSFGHSSLASSRALALAKISAQSKDPAGGRIGRNASGEPDGILEDSAQDIVGALIPAPSAQDRVVGARKALEKLGRQGVTSFLDALGDEPDILAFRAVETAGGLTARAHFAPRTAGLRTLRARRSGGLSALCRPQCHCGALVPVGKAGERYHRRDARYARRAPSGTDRASRLTGGPWRADRLRQ